MEAVELSCARCGYDLRGLVERRCPECGLGFDPNEPPVAEVAWLRRKQIGYVRAYWLTVEMVLRSPRRFAQQAWRWVTVDSQAGEWFRMVTVVVVTLSINLAAGIALLRGPWAPGMTVKSALLNVLQVWAVFVPALLAFFFVATLRVPIAMKHAGENVAERFSMLQKFCCAPLGLAPVIPVVVGVVAILSSARAIDVDAPWVFFSVLVLALVVSWIVACGMYLMMAGRVRVILLFGYGLAAVGLWAGAVFAAMAIGAFVSQLVSNLQ